MSIIRATKDDHPLRDLLEADARVLERIGHASRELTEPAPPPASGVRTATLNHLAGPGAVREWVELAQAEAQAIHRVRELAAARAQLESHLALVGTPRSTLDRALSEAGGLRVVGS